MAEKEKFQPKTIVFKGARAAFSHFHKPNARTDRKTGVANGKPKFKTEILLDPSNREQAATIAEIKQETVRALNHRFKDENGNGKFTLQMLEDLANATRSIPNFYLPWGYGNKLPEFNKKIYDGYADMFFLKLADENRPNLLNREGNPVVEGDAQCPYAGCYVAGTTTLYSYDNTSRGAGANLRTIVFMRDGTAFGGGQENAQQAFAAIGDLGNEASAGVAATGKDPFDI
jgi:hypothetical protein